MEAIVSLNLLQSAFLAANISANIYLLPEMCDNKVFVQLIGMATLVDKMMPIKCDNRMIVVRRSF
jgi:hypothetical protein